MNYTAKLKKIILKNSGIILTKDVSNLGIPRIYLTKLVDEGFLERIQTGVYVTKDTFDDDMYILQAKYKNIIFSHETALYLNDLTDRDPIRYSVTVPRGYNYQPIQSTGVHVFSVKKDLYNIGETEAYTNHGRLIKCYNQERTICDIIKSRNQLDIAIVTEALKQYFKKGDKNIPELMRYANKFKVDRILRNYLEVLL
jgi:predicted transcriptional regulator of viral defense system